MNEITLKPKNWTKHPPKPKKWHKYISKPKKWYKYTPPQKKFTKIPRKLKNEQNIGGFHYLLLQSVDKHAAYANFGRFY